MSYIPVQMNDFIYHICRRDEWEVALEKGYYAGSSQDLEDGFIHFSSKDQIVESAAKHRKGQVGLMLISVDVDVLGDALRWEESRRQKLFPHLYGELPTDAVSKAEALPLGPDGFHVFPEF